MELERIELLISRYLDGEATPQEREEVELWYAMIQKEDTAPIQEQLTTAQAYEKLRENLASEPRRRLPVMIRWAGWSAAAVLVLSFICWPLIKRQFSADIRQGELHVKKTGAVKGTLLTFSDGTHLAIDQQPYGRTKLANGFIADLGKDLLALESSPGANPNLYHSLSTPARRKYSVILPDGSRVWLNAGSSLRFPSTFDPRAPRQISITGEGYLEVAHQRDGRNGRPRPFIVNTAGQQISVLGTRFNVRAYPGSPVVTTLFQGSVKVKASNSQVLLKPGEAAKLVSGTLKLQEHADLDRAIAWRGNLFIFADSDLKEILTEFSRWYGIKIIYQTRLSRATFSGKIPMETDLGDALKIIEQEHILFKLQGDKLYVQSRP